MRLHQNTGHRDPKRVGPGIGSLLEPVPKWSRRLERSSVISVRDIENLELIDLHPFRSPETSVIKCTWISS